MKKNWLYCTLVVIPLMSSLTACNNEDDPNPNPNPEPTTTYGAYIVNTGNSGANDGSIQWFDMEKQTVSGDLYQAQNGKGIGDVQDLCVYGSKMYAIGSESSKIEILDLKGKLIKKLLLTTEDGKPKGPRYVTSGEGCVFFTATDGTVSRLDTLTQEITGMAQLGYQYPEGLTYANGKLYVNISNRANSGYIGQMVALVNPKSMEKSRRYQ